MSFKRIIHTKAHCSSTLCLSCPESSRILKPLSDYQPTTIDQLAILILEHVLILPVSMTLLSEFDPSLVLYSSQSNLYHPVRTYGILSNPILSYPILFYPIQSYYILSNPILSYPASYLIQYYPFLSNHNLIHPIRPIQSNLIQSIPIL